MRKLFLIILFPLSIFAQQKQSYQITGHIKGLREGEKINVNLIHGTGFKEFTDWNRQDSAYVKDGQFHVSGLVVDGPRLFILEFDKHPSNVCRILIGKNENITISSNMDIDSIPHNYLDNSLTIEGSPTNQAWHILDIAERNFYQTILGLNGCLKKIKDTTAIDKSLAEGFIKAKDIVNLNLYGNLLKNPEPEIKPAIPFFIYGQSMFEYTNHIALWKQLYDGWDDEMKQSYYGELLKTKLNLSVGQTFPEFSLQGTDGKNIMLKELLSKNGLTLIQFWAVHSVQRKQNQDELRRFYVRYHDKGLNVVAISSDTISYEWKGFVAAEQFPWYNLSDLKGRDGVVEKTYHELGNPLAPNTTNVLLDAHGNILAWDVTGAELEWYLAKYLVGMESNKIANISPSQ